MQAHQEDNELSAHEQGGEQHSADSTEEERGTDVQSVLYMLAVCAIIMAAVSVAHLLFILAYVRFATTPLAPALRFPRFEVCVPELAEARGA